MLFEMEAVCNFHIVIMSVSPFLLNKATSACFFIQLISQSVHYSVTVSEVINKSVHVLLSSYLFHNLHVNHLVITLICQLVYNSINSSIISSVSQ